VYEGILVRNQTATTIDRMTTLVAQALREGEGISANMATERIQGLEMFLELCARSTRALTPSIGIDKAWHAFLDHKDAYVQYCVERFGRAINHIECTDAHELNDNFLALKCAWEAAFGKASYEKYVSDGMGRCADCKGW
jgi:hypothetical protein